MVMHTSATRRGAPKWTLLADSWDISASPDTHSISSGINADAAGGFGLCMFGGGAIHGGGGICKGKHALLRFRSHQSGGH